jgi:hypothetical protein
MTRPSHSAAGPIAVAVAMLAVLLCGYVAGYFWLGEYIPGTVQSGRFVAPEPVVWREYPHRLPAILFMPAAKVEAKCRGHKVYVWPDPDDATYAAMRNTP